MTLIVTANSNDCKIYHYQRNPPKLILLKAMNHPEAKLKNKDIVSDRPGHYQSGSSHGAYSPHTDPKEVEISHFSRDIALALNREQSANHYHKLILITSPQMQGFIHQHLDKHVKEIINVVKKNLQHLDEHELLKYLQSDFDIIL